MLWNSLSQSLWPKVGGTFFLGFLNFSAMAQDQAEVVQPPLDRFDPGGSTVPPIVISAAQGIGCSLSDVSYSNPRRQSVLQFQNMVTASGPGITPSAGRRRCLLQLRISPEFGYQYALVRLVARGESLANEPDPGRHVGVSTHITGTSVSDQKIDATLDQFLQGPFQISSIPLEPNRVVWSPCARASYTYDFTVSMQEVTWQSVSTMRLDTLYMGWQKRRCL